VPLGEVHVGDVHIDRDDVEPGAVLHTLDDRVADVVGGLDDGDAVLHHNRHTDRGLTLTLLDTHPAGHALLLARHALGHTGECPPDSGTHGVDAGNLTGCDTGELLHNLVGDRGVAVRSVQGIKLLRLRA